MGTAWLVNWLNAKFSNLKRIVIVGQFVRNPERVLGCFKIEHNVPEIGIRIQPMGDLHICRCVFTKEIAQDNLRLNTRINPLIIQ